MPYALPWPCLGELGPPSPLGSPGNVPEPEGCTATDHSDYVSTPVPWRMDRRVPYVPECKGLIVLVDHVRGDFFGNNLIENCAWLRVGKTAVMSKRRCRGPGRQSEPTLTIPWILTVQPPWQRPPLRSPLRAPPFPECLPPGDASLW